MPHSGTDSDEDDITSDEDDITEARASTFVCASSLAQGRSHCLLSLLTFSQLSPCPSHSTRSCLKSHHFLLLPLTAS
jgi:hypothetical protein